LSTPPDFRKVKLQGVVVLVAIDRKLRRQNVEQHLFGQGFLFRGRGIVGMEQHWQRAEAGGNNFADLQEMQHVHKVALGKTGKVLSCGFQCSTEKRKQDLPLR
jgi:hypothetical protein